MSLKTHTYIAFDADTDMRLYNIMRAWKSHNGIDFNFENAHDLNTLRSYSSEETIKRRLRERMNQTGLMILLVGENTKNLYKFVRWEIETAMDLGLPIIVVNLNEKRTQDSTLCPPIIRDRLAVHIPFKKEIIRFAMDNWPANHYAYKSEGKDSWYYYEDSIYEKLGLNETQAMKDARERLRLAALRQGIRSSTW
jgi:hypothetical protein